MRRGMLRNTFKEFSDKRLKEMGNKCWFCGTEEAVLCFYLLYYKNHKQDKLYLHPDKAAYYYPACQTHMQKWVKARGIFADKLVMDGVSSLQIEQHLAKETDIFLAEYEPYDVTGFFMFIDKMSNQLTTGGYVPKQDSDPIIQLLPSIARELSAPEVDFTINRVKQYQNDFLFNDSSDYILLLNLVLQEVQIQRLQSQALSAKPGTDTGKIRKELIEMNKDYRETIASLGILRKDRDRIGGANIAEISALIGDENQSQIEIDTWDDELAEQLKGKKERDEKLGIY
jgi:hypothetical protein